MVFAESLAFVNPERPDCVGCFLVLFGKNRFYVFFLVAFLLFLVLYVVLGCCSCLLFLGALGLQCGVWLVDGLAVLPVAEWF